MFKNYLSVSNLSYSILGFQTLFEKVCFEVSNSQKVAIVGENGVGKTTLLKLLCGELLPSKGEIVINGKISLVPQSLFEFSGNIAQVLGVAEIIESLHKICENKATEIDFEIVGENWDIEAKIKSEFERWNLSHLHLDDLFERLSGGEKEKLLLIKNFISTADVLLFDEPTNNLDVASRRVFLEELKACSKLVLIVSHDRNLLNEMDVILELSKNKVQKFSGNFEFYQQEKARQVATIESKIVGLKETQKNVLKTKIENQIKADKSAKSGRAKVFSDKYSSLQAGAMKGLSLASNAKKKNKLDGKILETTEEIKTLQLSILEEAIKIPLPEKPFIKDKLIEIENLCFSYGERVLFKNFNLFVGGKDRMVLKGKNGAGKTTLLKIILGVLSPQSGSIELCASVVYLNQELSLLDREKTLLENLQEINPQMNLNEAHRILANFKFRNELAHKKVSVLSGGELLRGCLAAILGTDKQPELIILDEPTNNLDLQSLQVLESALQQYQGALLVVSHDEKFLEQININRELLL
ncbi:MAG: ATP-binding cassette domain-containing protein [Alphaproteobacteria bacterium]|nr:ATP-binding cassette domain-containing protein [Alphaproteobacteria bacterium]